MQRTLLTLEKATLVRMLSAYESGKPLKGGCLLCKYAKKALKRDPGIPQHSCMYCPWILREGVFNCTVWMETQLDDEDIINEARKTTSYRVNHSYMWALLRYKPRAIPLLAARRVAILKKWLEAIEKEEKQL